MSEPTPDLLDATMLSQARLIAKGRRIREVQRLMGSHGGTVSGWMKKSGPVFLFEDEEYEFHWYEHPDLGRFEIKPKKVNEQ